MDFTNFMLMWVVVVISIVGFNLSFALSGIRKSIDRLASEIRSSDSKLKHNDEEANKPDAGDGK